ncbi:hypothetical protein SLA2020_421120 [Shorea laevis]
MPPSKENVSSNNDCNLGGESNGVQRKNDKLPAMDLVSVNNDNAFVFIAPKVSGVSLVAEKTGASTVTQVPPVGMGFNSGIGGLPPGPSNGLFVAQTKTGPTFFSSGPSTMGTQESSIPTTESSCKMPITASGTGGVTFLSKVGSVVLGSGFLLLDTWFLLRLLCAKDLL